MRVVGTAGHVDHGKTALIKSLTGIDADRLPEEKARGMTTDLGFAYYRGGNGEYVGVVDVPGHERYLRNMVAGAWGLDLVVLVVAADDGWMPQTGLHASIAASLAAPSVVIAVTKADAVEATRAERVALDSVERASALFGFRPEAVLVSNVTGEGLGELKAAIGRALEARPPAVSDGAYLYVDRAFSPLGGGTVVTGTLVGGSVGSGDELELLPRGERVKVRGVQSYRERVERAFPACRAAVSLTGLKGGVVRGDVLSAPGSGVVCGSELLVRFLPLPGSESLFPADAKGRPALRPGLEAELAAGSARRDAELWPIGKTGFARAVLRSPLAFPAGCGFVALRRGGAELLGRGVIARPIRAAPEGRKALAAALPRAVASTDALEEAGFGRDRSLALRVSVAVFYQGWTAAPEGVPLGVALKAGFEPAPAPGAADEAAFLFDPVRWAAYAEAVAAAAAEPGGLSRATGESIFASVLGAASRQADSLAGARAADSKSAFEASVSRLEAQKALSRNGAAWTVPGSARALSPAERETLERLVAAGTSGLEPGKTAQREDARPLKALCSFGEAVPLDGGIFFSRAAYEACSAAILRGRKPGDRFTVPEAKERSALSRKYILPLLNRMESKGLVKRSGDERIVL